jgi:protein-S-isoprenylcysteine O-methyltransferase Ste14
MSPVANAESREMRNSVSGAAISSRIARFDLTKPQQSRGYDALMRLPILTWSIVLAIVSASGLEQYARAADPTPPGAIYAVNIAMRLSVIAYLAILAATVIVRMRPMAKARGAEPRISALIGTFLITVVVLFPRRELSLTAGCVSTLLVLVGNALTVFVLMRLRGSFSIMAEARQLVTSGAYRFVRHPLYLAEEIATIGSVMQFLSIWTTMLLVAQIAFQLRRMRNEETLLTEVFPDYATYREKTARIIPGIY